MTSRFQSVRRLNCSMKDLGPETDPSQVAKLTNKDAKKHQRTSLDCWTFDVCVFVFVDMVLS